MRMVAERKEVDLIKHILKFVFIEMEKTRGKKHSRSRRSKMSYKRCISEQKTIAVTGGESHQRLTPRTKSKGFKANDASNARAAEKSSK